LHPFQLLLRLCPHVITHTQHKVQRSCVTSLVLLPQTPHFHNAHTHTHTHTQLKSESNGYVLELCPVAEEDP